MHWEKKNNSDNDNIAETCITICNIHTHTHIWYRVTGLKNSVCWSSKCLELVSEGMQSHRKPEEFREVLPGGGQACEKDQQKPQVVWLNQVWSLMCLLKSGESREGCEAVTIQKDKRGKNQQLSCAHASSFVLDSFRNREPVMLL